jgi:dipeptidyl aminopeptidase/acylaminoacyl peptidase
VVTPETIRFNSPLRPGGPPTISLAAGLYQPDDAGSGGHPGLIVGHGAGSRRSSHEEFCQHACASGFVVIAVDFRGHGESDGVADGPLELDLYAAADWLRSHPAVDSAAVCYRGSSMGGFYGLKAAPGAGFAAIVLLCPATESVILNALDEADNGVDTPTGEKARWDLGGMRSYFEQQQCLALTASIECPTMLVHVRGDEVVPFSHTLLLTQSLRVDTTLLALQEGSHTSAQHDPAVHQRTIEWVKEALTSYSART